jgi:Kef-type K+ transport system membrane component KefB
LSVVSNLVQGDGITSLGVLLILGKAVGFLVLAVGLGGLLLPRLFDWIGRLRVRDALIASALCFALALAALASLAGSALIIGAFAAGLVLRRSNHHKAIEMQLRPLVALFSPIFFVNVGAAADFTLLNPNQPGAGGLLLLAGGLTLLAIIGKVAAGWAAPWQRFHRLAVGVGMVPRGEVGLIFADVGRRAGLLNDAIFSAVLLMVMLTTFLAPVWLKFILPRRDG